MQQIIRLDSINFMEQLVMLSNVSKILCFLGSKRCGDTETWYMYKDNKALMSFVKWDFRQKLIKSEILKNLYKYSNLLVCLPL